ncbi:core turret protein [Baboon orthoreovirus]|uniref:Core turret protein n=1 Tax=Baboon orthoreovirus TaxID=75888 RepID=G0YZL9_9REOV|nr:core turret protein [Baboon orthoreovirus]AEK86189.1 core turret protein [Baboon orthoreovirus]
MARLHGLIFSDSLSSPIRYRENHRYTYDEYIRQLKDPEHNQLWSVLRNVKSNEVNAIQLKRPLNGITIMPTLNHRSVTYEAWKVWIIGVLRNISIDLLNYHPLKENYSKTINSIIAAQICDCAMSSRPYRHLFDCLFVEISIVDDILHSNILVSDSLWCVSNKIICLVAGLKYLRFFNYEFDDYDICLFGKDELRYAVTYYAKTYYDLESQVSLCSSCIFHIDRPSVAPHIIVPSDTATIHLTGFSISYLDGLLLESAVEQFHNNSESSAEKEFSRLDECYCIAKISADHFDGDLTSRLSVLSSCATNGLQLLDIDTSKITNLQVISLLLRLMSNTQSTTLLDWSVGYVLMYIDSPSILPSIYPDYYRTTGMEIGLKEGLTRKGKRVEIPVIMMKQYGLTWIDQQDGELSWKKRNKLPVSPLYGKAISGKAICYRVKSNDQKVRAVSSDHLPDLTESYFSKEESALRDKFKSYRLAADRSLLKDICNWTFLYSFIDDLGKDAIPSGINACYLGASGNHPTNEPTIITKIRKNEIAGVKQVANIAQFGYDVTKGIVCDLNYPISTGTYDLVYCDVDQVQSASNSYKSSDQLTISLFDRASELISPSGSICFKINFPTRTVMSWILRRLSSMFTVYGITKPLVMNNVEVFVVGVKKLKQYKQPVILNNMCVFMHRVINGYRELNIAIKELPVYNGRQNVHDPIFVNEIQLLDPYLDSDHTLDAEALTYLSNVTFGSTIHFSSYDYFGARMLRASGVTNKYAYNRYNRLAYLPIPRFNALNAQVREIGYGQYKMFDSVASPWVLLSSFYNYQLCLNVRSEDVMCDLGTGPEARILHFIPSNVPITLVDVREFNESDTPWMTYTNFVIADYLSDELETLGDVTLLTCLLSLGAACASSGVDMLSGLRRIFSMISDNNIDRAILQLNLPIGEVKDAPRDFIEINEVDHTYVFKNNGRVEPYITMAQFQQLLSEHLSSHSYQIVLFEQNFSFLNNIFNSFISTTTEHLENFSVLINYMPLIILSKSTLKFEHDTQLTVGERMHLSISNVKPNTSFLIYHDGVEMLKWNDGMLVHDLFVESKIEMVNDNILIELVTDEIGNYHLECDYGSKEVFSFFVHPPDDTITIHWPVKWDFTDYGTIINIDVDDYYNLEVLFVSDQGELNIVNPDKYAIIPNGLNHKTLSWIVDLSDRNQTFILRDRVNDTSSHYLFLSLDKLSDHAWSTTNDLYITAPDRRLWQVMYNGSPVAHFHDGKLLQKPSNWVKSNVNYGAILEYDTYLAPSGSYELMLKV